MEKQKRDSPARKKQTVAAIAIGTIVALGMVLTLAISGEDSGPSDQGRSRVLSVEALREAVAGSDTPIYWAGERAGTKLELSRPEPGRTYVRYLTGDAKAGDSRATFLTVATYERQRPVQELRQAGGREGAVLAEAPGGATVYYDRRAPQSVYLAYPGVKAQIEVYDPNVEKALKLVNSGQIVPVN